jgi:hypothetical protein
MNLNIIKRAVTKNRGRGSPVSPLKKSVCPVVRRRSAANDTMDATLVTKKSPFETPSRVTSKPKGPRLTPKSLSPGVKKPKKTGEMRISVKTTDGQTRFARAANPTPDRIVREAVIKTAAARE